MNSLRGIDRRALVLVATSLGFAVVQLDVSVVNVAIAPIGQTFRAGTTGLQWVVNAYTLALAALILSAGALADRVGARRLYVGGFAVFTLASLAAAAAPGLGSLIAARAVQGLGAAALVPCSLSLLQHHFPEPGARVRAIAIWAAGASVALAGGPLVGGLLTAGLGWRAVFLINLPLGVLGMLLALRSAGETARGHARPLDLVGQILAVLLLGSLATAVIASGRQPTREVAVLAAGAALIAGVAFVVAQHRREERAMLPLRLFRSPTYRVMTGVGLLINVGFYGLIFLLSLEFQQVRHASALQTGLAFAPTTVAVGVGNLASGRLAARYGATRVVAGGAAVSAIGYVGLLLAGPTAPYATLVSPLVVLGGGLGVLVPAMTSALLGAAPLNLSGVASGTLNTARQTGSALGVSLFGALATRGISAGLRTSLVLCVTASLLVTALAARLSRV